MSCSDPEKPSAPAQGGAAGPRPTAPQDAGIRARFDAKGRPVISIVLCPETLLEKRDTA